MKNIAPSPYTLRDATPHGGIEWNYERATRDVLMPGRSNVTG